MSASEAQSPKHEVFVRFTSQAAVKSLFPNSASLRVGKTAPKDCYGFVSFDSEADAQAALKADIPGVVVEPMKSREPRFSHDFFNITTIQCHPNVCEEVIPENASLVVLHDFTNETGGHIYKRTDYPSKHMQSIQFVPNTDSSLSSKVTLGGHNLTIASIHANTTANSIFVSVLIHEEATNTTGVVSLRRVTRQDGSYSYFRNCFNVLVNPEDINKDHQDLVDIHFISIESITLDPVTCLWNNLRICIDAVTAPLSVYKIRAVRYNNNRRFSKNQSNGRYGRRPAPRNGRVPNRNGRRVTGGRGRGRSGRPSSREHVPTDANQAL